MLTYIMYVCVAAAAGCCLVAWYHWGIQANEAGGRRRTAHAVVLCAVAIILSLSTGCAGAGWEKRDEERRAAKERALHFVHGLDPAWVHANHPGWCSKH
jgi:hypothetical protein